MVSAELQNQNKHNRQRGRYGEVRLAKKVGGVVVGRSKFIILPNGMGIKIDCQRPPDVITSMFSFESKYFTHIPVSIKKIMTQAIINAPDGLTPVGVLADREEHSVYYILMEKDWLALHGREEPQPSGNAPQSKSGGIKVSVGSLISKKKKEDVE